MYNKFIYRQYNYWKW